MFAAFYAARYSTKSAKIVIIKKIASVYRSKEIASFFFPSKYNMIGNGTSMDPYMWALGQGPGDQRVYDLLNKHVKLNAKLVKYL